MGSGKTHWGRLLAKELDFDFADTDEMIVQQTGESVASLFSNHGEAHFRQLEADLLRNGLPPKDAVISTGGGMPCFLENMDIMLAKGVVIWLAPDLTTIAERIWRNKEKRPLIAQCDSVTEVVGKLNDLLEKRKVHYAKADIVENEVSIDMPDLIKRIESVGKFVSR
jgi:shikimate kinase